MRHLLILGGLVSCIAMQANHRGYVFVDSNGNGIYDKGEKALSGICVSDGKNVVKTDKKGFYSLPGHSRERFLFITTPSGYKTDNEYYRKIDKSIQEYNFGVVPYNSHIKNDGSHRFIQISDTEIGELQGHDDWIQNIKDYAANNDASFVIHTGDICYEEGMKSHIKLMNTANMNLPMFYCIGNHDLVKGVYGEEVFEKYYGPVFYSFDAGSVHYIVTPMPSGDYKPGYTNEDVYEWLKNDLAQQPDGKPIIIFNHDLLTSGEDFRFYKNNDEFIDLDAHNLKAWIYGHWHINYVRKHRSAYSICTSTPVRGGIDHASSAFRIYDIDRNGDFKTELRYTYLDKSIEIASISNLQSPVTKEGLIPLSVNTYSTVSHTKQVEYKCRIEDGSVVRSGKLKQNSNFNWSGEMQLPNKAIGKLITVSVEALYCNGEKAQMERSFFYSGSPLNEIDVNGKKWNNLLSDAKHVQNQKSNLKNLKLSWVKNIGSNIYMTSPVLENSRLFMASLDEDNVGNAFVVSLDAKSGKQIWKSYVDGSIRNSIALTDGKLFAQDIHGMLYAFNQSDGSLVWKKKLNVNILPALNDGLVTENNIVYAGAGRSLCALDASTGKELWVNKDWNSREGCTATLAVGNNVVIGHSHWGALYANDKHTGKLVWSQSKDGLRNRSASPAVLGNLLYLASRDCFFVIDSKTGDVVVKKKLSVNVDVASTPLVTDKEIIFGTAENGLMALDKETFEKKWEFKTGQSLIFSSPYTRNPSCTVETSPVLSGDVVYFGASDGTIYGVDRNKGTLVWKHNTGAPVWGTVAILGNALFAVDFSGNIYGFVSE